MDFNDSLNKLDTFKKQIMSYDDKTVKFNI